MLLFCISDSTSCNTAGYEMFTFLASSGAASKKRVQMTAYFYENQPNLPQVFMLIAVNFKLSKLTER